MSILLSDRRSVVTVSRRCSAGRVAAGLKVFPATVELRGQDDRQGVVVQVVDGQGVTKDVTAAAKLRLADPALAALTGQTLAPKKDGSTQLIVEHGGLKAEVPVVVKDAGQSRPVSFRLDVMPVFMKHGCNNGSCHGAARGKDGFMLSLFGYDPAGDYYRLTRQIVGRRVDLAVPGKEPDAREDHRRRAAHRRQALRHRTTTTTRPCCAG